MAKKPATQLSPIVMLAPVAFVLIGYVYFFQMPLQKSFSENSQRYNNLKKEENSLDAQRTSVELSIQENVDKRKSLDAEQVKLESEKQTLLNQQVALRSSIFQPNSPAATVEEVEKLFLNHNVKFVHSEPENSNEEGASALPESLQEVATVLESRETLGTGRSQYRLKFVGSFSDFQAALTELNQKRSDVITLAIQMEESLSGTDQHIWYITLLI